MWKPTFQSFILLLMITPMQSVASTTQVFRYIITEANAPTSFDPLAADSTENLPAARMLYLTPLEISPTDDLTSTVLSSFGYDEKMHKITFVVRKGLSFTDGSKVEPADVAFSIARMAYTRPLFPVIQHIKGLEEWRNSHDALKLLPSGIHIVDQKIEIQLTRAVHHPLFRFCLELFSIIPKSSVELKTNTLKTPRPPGSGYYELAEHASSGWLFKKRKAFISIHGERAPEEIRFEFKAATDLVAISKTIQPNTVASSNEGLFTPTEMSEITKNTELRAAPTSRFGAMYINPNVGPFTKKECRRLFANTFRETLIAEHYEGFQCESSIFTKIMPGYIRPNELARTLHGFSKECRAELKSATFEWGLVKGLRNFYFETAIKKTFTTLGMEHVTFREFQSKKEIYDSFYDGKIGVTFGASGFWPVDPAGDIQMLFTPNLHKVLSFAANDDKLQELIHSVQDETNSKMRVAKFEAINRRLYDESIFNVYGHFRRFIITNKSRSLRDIPLAISSIAPWQVFGKP
jgi:ABC-type transport system substrate-binding protein